MTKVKNPTHGSFLSMKKRCEEPSHKDYKYYGGKGVKVCDRWRVFKNFLKDMGERPIGKTLDRIDSNGDYKPSNCRWATPKEQIANRGPRKDSILFNGIVRTRKQWAEHTGINYWTIRERLETLGWTVERALTTPVRSKSDSQKTGD